jgi:hypothetical protein
MKALFLSLGSRPLYRIALCCAAFLNATPAASDCPSGSYAVTGGLVKPPVVKAHIFALSRSKSAWTLVPHDVISLNRLAPAGQLPAAFFPQPLSARWFRVDFQSQWWARPFFSDQDVIVTPRQNRGLKVPPSDLRVFATRAGCAGGRMWEWEQSALGVSGPGSKHFLYLLECRRPPEGVSTTSGDYLPAVAFDAKALKIESQGFRYQMNRGNQMLFDRLEASAGNGSMEVFLEDGNFDIRADFKNFFEMHFTSGNVGSKVVANRDESASALARLSFNLKLLFLKLDLQLNTDLLFFRDAVFLPMIMKIPRDAWRYVNPGSGVLYSWFPAPGTRLVEGWIDMPRRRIFKAKGDIKIESRQVAEKHCQADGLCRFRVAVGRGPDNRIVLMELIVARGMVNGGFFPQYVSDAVPEAGELGWSWSGSNSKRRREGIYFELSQLAKGEHSFEIWLRLIPQDANPESESFCPSGTALREISR